MIYPKSNEYRAAFQHAKDTLIDEILSAGIVKRNALGPQVLSGNFAYIFEIMSKYRIKYAVRCFQYEILDRRERYKAISRYLKSLQSDYFVDFEYQDEGIIVGGTKFPIIKMGWVEGDLLGDFIKDNYANRFKMKNLLNSLGKMAKFIEKNTFAHGDIQTGNIIVSDNGRVLKLIDYDGMYVDELKSFGNAECGVPNFQHPKRANAWSRKLDRFSFIVLHVALLALVERHYLWDETDSDTDAILFKGSDFENPKNSKVFQKLYALQSLKKYVESFEEICKGQFRNIPSLENFIKENSTKRRTSILVPIASTAIISFAAYCYYNENIKPESYYAQLPFTFADEREPIVEPPQNIYRYNIKEYDKMINTQRYSREHYPNDINNTLSLVMLYAMSGFDDEKLYDLALPLQQLGIQDERLYFALAVFNWRRADISQADKFIDIIRQDLPQDAGLRKLVLSLDEVIQKNINSYRLYYNIINLNEDDKAQFAKSMLLLENTKLYAIMEKMYQESFTGFSSEHRFNTNLSFKDWFDIYDAYNVAQAIKSLTVLHKKFPKDSHITYNLAINIGISYLADNKEGCSFSSSRYANIAAILEKEADIINADKALEYANELLKTDFPKGYSYYALGMAYYAKSEFEQARKAFISAAENLNNEDINAKIEERLQDIKKTKECYQTVSGFKID